MTLVTYWLGFPAAMPLPTHVEACGDGVHGALIEQRLPSDCFCGAMTVIPRRMPWSRSAYLVIVADASAIRGQITNFRLSRGTVRLVP